MGKSYSDYTIGDLIRLKGGFVKKYLDEKELPDFIEACDYFASLGTTSGIDVRNLSALDTGFVQLKVGLPIYRRGRGAQNECFIRLKERIDAGEGPEPLIDDSGARAVIAQALETGVHGSSEQSLINGLKAQIKDSANYIQSLQNDLDNYQNTIQDKLNYIREERNNMAKFRQELEVAYEQSKSEVNPHWKKVHDELEKIQNAGLWSIEAVRFETGFKICEVLFTATQDIVMKRFNPALDLDDEINFGMLKMQMVFRRNSNMARILPGKRCIRIQSHCHPNISSSGGICYGGTDQGTALHEMMLNNDLYNFSLGIHQLLTTYSTDAPYISHESFKYRQDLIKDGRANYGVAHTYKKTMFPVDELSKYITKVTKCIKVSDGSVWEVVKLGKNFNGTPSYSIQPEGNTSTYNVIRVNVSIFNEGYNIIVEGAENESVLEAPCEGEDNVPSEENDEGNIRARESEVNWEESSDTGSLTL